MEVDELVKRYQSRIGQNRRIGTSVAEQIRQYIAEKLSKNPVIPLRDIVQEMINDGTAEELNLEPKYNVVYNRVRQAILNKKKNVAFTLGLDEDDTVVVVKLS